ncbi:MAG TPA: hypothetical protein VK188_00855 [Holophaga sp.]|nr:hypothetical protein [Holophaga sp.]
MDDKSKKHIDDLIFNFGGFHDCRVNEICLDFKNERMVIKMENILFGLYNTQDYEAGSGYILLKGIDEVQFTRLNPENNYIVKKSISNRMETDYLEILMGNGQILSSQISELEVWKGDKMIACSLT